MITPSGGLIPAGGPEGGNQQLSGMLNAVNEGGVRRPNAASNTSAASPRGSQQVKIQDLQNILQGMGFQLNITEAGATPAPASASRTQVPQPMGEEESRNVGQGVSGGDQHPESVPKQPSEGELSRDDIADLSSLPSSSAPSKKQNDSDEKEPPDQ